MYKYAALVALAVGSLEVYFRLRANPSKPPVSSQVPARVHDITRVIGNTPLVRLNYLSDITNCEIFGKLELSNPGGSAKDRVALAIVESAEREGKLRPGQPDLVFEGTSGSTGISLALVCRAKGYEAHIVVPDDTSHDKQTLLKSYGAHLHVVRPAGIADPNHYVNVARRLTEEVNSDTSQNRQAVFANQFENEENFKVHYNTTGPEISQQMPEITCFIHGAGTGGTISGVAGFLKQHLNSAIEIVLADVPGSGLLNRVLYGVMFNKTEREGTRRRHQVDTVVEGIGLNRVTRNLAFGLDNDFIDDSLRIEDADARYMASVMVEKEGLFIGSSSAVNCVAAFRQAVKGGPNQKIVTILCDSGTRHLSKFWALPITPCKVEQELKEQELKEH